MCGRYVLKQNLAEICAAFGANTAMDDFFPTYNAAPETTRPIVVSNRVGDAVWGWPVTPGLSPVINIRSEGMASKTMFATSVRMNRRCIVPASGFYEWDSSGQPFYVEAADAPLIGFCGLWTRASDFTVRFAIITRAALPHLAPIHPRMPLTLMPAQSEAWLKGGILPEPPLLDVFPVGNSVNSTSNNGPELLDKLAAAPQGNLFSATGR